MPRYTAAAPILKTLLVSDLVGSTQLVDQLGDERSAQLFRRHDRLARDLLSRFDGREIDKTDGFLLLFERPVEAVRYALAYHAELAEMSEREGVEMGARVGIHVGEVILHENPAVDVARGAKPLEVDGLAKPVAARLMALARSRQTLLSRGAFDLARRGEVGTPHEEQGLRWLAHGSYRVKGVDDLVEVFEVGLEGAAPLEPPEDSPKAKRVVAETVVPGAGREQNQLFPGERLAGRYRIVERIGKGGMGEVYRAEDLKLGQPVALKLLPAAFRSDPARLARFFDEARAARQVTHPNVCRVHDVGDDDGLHFLSMEYVDGEDLASLLRRIGRIPRDKAAEIGSQLCAGLAAIHEQGLLHRDLKPANILIDGRGRARITDFGLATLSETVRAAEVSVGTPVYMAPEQLAGDEMSARSELYTLGLVLYEVFTGRAPFPTRSGQEPAARHETTLATPGSIVAGLDPAVDQVILSCLEEDPARRPGSALEVGEALAGGDLLVAAIAADETPSPELVAAARVRPGPSPRLAFAWLLSLILGALLVAFLAEDTQLTRMASLEKPPEVLAERAREVLRQAGFSDPPRDSAFGFRADSRYLAHLAATDRSPRRWSRLATEWPGPILFWYRQSPSYLVPHNQRLGRVSYSDPPRRTPGMASVYLDASGRLRRFDAVPQDLYPVPPPVPGTRSAFDWSRWFSQAGLELADFEPEEPTWTPSVYADHRVEWHGTYPDARATPIRVRGAALDGRPVAFRVVAPWAETSPDVRLESGTPTRAAHVVAVSWFIGVLLGAGWVARRNVRLGRSDRKAASRLTFYLLVIGVLRWVFGAHHVGEANAQLRLFTAQLGSTLLWCAVLWISYLAAEPYLRRLWPRLLISWVRLLDGRFRDPLLGRDVLIGCSYGLVVALVIRLVQIFPAWLGEPPFRPDAFSGFAGPGAVYSLDLVPLHGWQDQLWTILSLHHLTLTNAFCGIVGLLLLRLLLRRTWLAVAATVATGTVVLRLPMGNLYWELLLTACVAALGLLVLFRFGLLAMVIGTFVEALLRTFPLTFDLSTWYAEASVLALGVFFALAVYGFRVSLAGRPLFRDELLSAEPAR